MTIQRSKQFLVQGYINNLKRRKMMTVLLETRIVNALPLHRRAYTWVAAARSARWIKSIA